MYQLRETNALVEEFMLLANIEVAKQTVWAGSVNTIKIEIFH
jgi:exoribonuclease R